MNSAALHYRQCGGRLRSPPPDAAVFAAAHSVRQNFNALGIAHRQAYRPGAAVARTFGGPWPIP